MIEVYCDENNPDLFTSQNPHARYLMIGSLWLQADSRQNIKDRIKHIRNAHDKWGEIKWNQVTSESLEFYKSLINLFSELGEELRFRCIAVDCSKFDRTKHGGDDELGFYKFYYQVLHKWIDDRQTYRIFCDIKQNQDPSRLAVLKRCLQNSKPFATISDVQALPSKQVVLTQLTDLLLGATSARLNSTLNSGSPKERLVIHLEGADGIKIRPTCLSEKKFNVFIIDFDRL